MSSISFMETIREKRTYSFLIVSDWPRVQQRSPHMEIIVLALVLITAMATVDLPEHPEEKAERVPTRKARRAR